ncbi:MAG: glycosyltransferase family 4 protein [Candidatus Odinarchaeia archaeon]
MKVIQIMPISQWSHGANFNQVMFDGWHSRVGKQIAKRTNLKLECWIIERNLSKKIEIEKDGITYKAFPSIGQYYLEYSPLLFAELKKFQRENERVLIHIHCTRTITSYILSRLFNQFPKLIQHHGEVACFTFSRKWQDLFSELVDRFTLNHMDHIFVLTPEKKRCLEKRSHIDPNKISIQTMGVDYDKFISIEKNVARNRIGIPFNADVILYVGRFVKRKGVDKIISIYKTLKKQRNIKLVLLGGYKNDPLYSMAKQEADILYERHQISNEKLSLFYSAADVCCMLGDESVNNFAGPMVVIMESLACNTPVVTTTQLLMSEDDERKVGFGSKTNFHIIDNIINILDKKDEYTDCRIVSQKYYSWDIIINKTLEEYKKTLLNRSKF